MHRWRLGCLPAYHGSSPGLRCKMTALSDECGLLMLPQVPFRGSYGHQQVVGEQDCSLSGSSACLLLVTSQHPAASLCLAVPTTDGSVSSTACTLGKRFYPSACSFGWRNELSVHFR